MVPNIKMRGIDLNIKAIKEDGTFIGYGSVFDVVDSYNEVVAKGAFRNSLRRLAEQGRSLPILWQHRTDEPIGVWDSLHEDERGLRGTGTLWFNEAPNAKVAYKGMQAKAITGLSVGYHVIASSYNEMSGIRTLEEIDLVECSIVTVPANDHARIDAMKARGKLLNFAAFIDRTNEFILPTF